MATQLPHPEPSTAHYPLSTRTLPSPTHSRGLRKDAVTMDFHPPQTHKLKYIALKLKYIALCYVVLGAYFSVSPSTLYSQRSFPRLAQGQTVTNN